MPSYFDQSIIADHIETLSKHISSIEYCDPGRETVRTPKLDFALSLFPNLKEYYTNSGFFPIDRIISNADIVSTVLRLKNLRVLVMQITKRDQIISSTNVISQLTCLTRLSIAYPTYAIEFPPADFSVFANFSTLTSLRVVYFQRCITDRALESICASCTNLRSISLQNSMEITTLKPIADHLPNLRSLDLTDCSFVTDESIAQLTTL